MQLTLGPQGFCRLSMVCFHLHKNIFLLHTPQTSHFLGFTPNETLLFYVSWTTSGIITPVQNWTDSITLKPKLSLRTSAFNLTNYEINYVSNYYFCLHSTGVKTSNPFFLAAFTDITLTYRNLFKVYNLVILYKCIHCEKKLPSS